MLFLEKLNVTGTPSTDESPLVLVALVVVPSKVQTLLLYVGIEESLNIAEALAFADVLNVMKSPDFTVFRNLA